MGAGWFLISSFLIFAAYLSLVSLVLNVRFYATEWMEGSSFGFVRVALNKIAFAMPEGPVSKYGDELSIVIPKIGVDAPIIAQVDPGNYKDYMRALKKGVAHAKGTYLPGEGGRSYLFAHSTNIDPRWVSRYNAVFYLLSKLRPGDMIFVWRDGKKLTYRVRQTKIVGKNDTSYLSVEGKKDELVLQTCYPPGTTLRRFLVLADLVESQ